MGVKQDFKWGLQVLIEEAEKNGVDVAIYAAQVMYNEALQVRDRNVKVVMVDRQSPIPMMH